MPSAGAGEAARPPHAPVLKLKRFIDVQYQGPDFSGPTFGPLVKAINDGVEEQYRAWLARNAGRHLVVEDVSEDFSVTCPRADWGYVIKSSIVVKYYGEDVA